MERVMPESKEHPGGNQRARRRNVFTTPPGSCEPQIKPVFPVEIQHNHRRAPDGRRSRDPDTVPLEMIFPMEMPGMKQFGDLARLGIDSREIGSLPQIAVDAREAKTLGVVRTAVFSWANMFNVQCRQWRVVLMKLAVLATMAGANASQPPSSSLLLQSPRFTSQDGDEFVCPDVALVFRQFVLGKPAFGGFRGKLLDPVSERLIGFGVEHGFLFARKKQLKERRDTSMESGLDAHEVDYHSSIEFVKVPIPSIVIFTTSPLRSVKSSPGTIPVPVMRSAPAGNVLSR